MYAPPSKTGTSITTVPPTRALGTTFAPQGLLWAMGGTGSVLDIARATEWREILEARSLVQIEMGVKRSDPANRPDLRTAAEHIANIRNVLNPAIADLATALGVSRQAIYKWISGEASPEPAKLKRVSALSHAADAFETAKVTRASLLFKMKAFDGRSLLDLVAADQLSPLHIQTLIAESLAMESAHHRSGLPQSKAKPSNDWQSELSIPGSSEG